MAQNDERLERLQQDLVEARRLGLHDKVIELLNEIWAVEHPHTPIVE